jgi:excisionase family DNA binding protein
MSHLENTASGTVLVQTPSDFQPDCTAVVPANVPAAGQHPGLLTIREASALLRLSESTIRNAIRLGQLRAYRFGTRGGSIRIGQADLDDYVAGAATAPCQGHMSVGPFPPSTGGEFKSLDASRLLAAEDILAKGPRKAKAQDTEKTQQ